MKTHVAYAYRPTSGDSPRLGTGQGNRHIIVDEPLSGRLTRAVGDALCKPAAKFSALMDVTGKANCKRCLEIAARLAQEPS